MLIKLGDVVEVQGELRILTGAIVGSDGLVEPKARRALTPEQADYVRKHRPESIHHLTGHYMHASAFQLG